MKALPPSGWSEREREKQLPAGPGLTLISQPAQGSQWAPSQPRAPAESPACPGLMPSIQPAQGPRWAPNLPRAHTDAFTFL